MENNNFSEVAHYLQKNKFSKEDKQWLLNQSILRCTKEGIDLAINGGADINDENDPISTAIKLKNLDLVQYLVEEKNCNIRNYNINNIQQLDTSHALISLAAAFSNPTIIDYLVSKGLDIHANSEHAFCWACSHDELENVKHIFYKYHPNINICNTISGETPLSWSVTCGNLDIVKFLLNQNVLIDFYTLDHLLALENPSICFLFKDKLTNEHVEYLVQKLNEGHKKSSINSFVMNLFLEKKLPHSLSQPKKTKI